MFSTHFKNKYDLSYAYPEEDHAQDIEIVEAQQAFLRHLVDENEVPSDLETKIYGTEIKIATLRDAVRYAQDRCAGILIEVTEQDIKCEHLGMPEEYGDRFDYYRGIIEHTVSKFPCGEHIGDETWLQSAQPQELITEAANCVDERYYMEGVWANMDKYIKTHIACKERREKGLVSVYKRPERKSEEDDKALVKWAVGTTRGGRPGRTTLRGRGRGSVVRTDGSVRGWK